MADAGGAALGAWSGVGVSAIVGLVSGSIGLNEFWSCNWIDVIIVCEASLVGWSPVVIEACIGGDEDS